MAITRLLRSLPLKKQTVIKSLLLATLLFIVYQVTFVVELSESAKPKSLRDHLPKAEKAAEKEKSHPKDIRLGNDRENRKMNIKIGENSNKNLHLEVKEEKVVKKENDLIVKEEKVIEKEKKVIHVITSSQKSKSTIYEAFTCRASGKVISKDKVNDDYCDCPEDGSDEPRTNACTNSKFSCNKTTKGFPKVLPSAWVNDGICDCCDGSDEWQNKIVKTFLPLELQKKVGQFLSPCPNRCP